MRPINLLPTRYRPARSSGERPGIGYFALGALAVLFLMVLLLVITSNSTQDAKDKTAQAQAEQAEAQAKIGQLQAFGDFQTLAASRESAVRGVAQVRFDYERLMREVALVLPHNTYLTSFSSQPGSGEAAAASGGASAAGPAVTIQGCAPDHKGVATAVVRLRQLHNVTDVNLQGSSINAAGASTTGGVCKASFSAVLSFKPESDSTAPSR